MAQANRGLLIALAVLIALLLVGPLLIGGTIGTGAMGPGMMGWGWGSANGIPGNANVWMWGLGMGLGGLIMVAFWSALFIGIVLLVRSTTAAQFTSSGGAGGSEDPLTILRRRYAAGELDQASFERMRSELVDDPRPAPTNGRTKTIR